MQRSDRRWRWLVPAVLAVIGLLLVTTARLAHGTDLRADRLSELTDLINTEQRQADEVAAQVERLRDQVEAATASGSDPEDAELQQRIQEVGAAAGMDEVVGPGLTVTLDDAPIPSDGIPDGYAVDDYVVHQQDLQGVVNALWAGGAQALQMMDQRIISTSAVRCVGNTLILKGRVYAPPYTVTAVGPVDRMQRALDASPGVGVYRQYSELIGLGYDVETLDPATVVAYEGSLDLRYARGSS
ncbi:MAG TPA: DUF881 domain-containing protein [Actinomycetes bacterium]|nr:DUF881 domain-containing protein [Actinomycetes bacterium]